MGTWFMTHQFSSFPGIFFVGGQFTVFLYILWAFILTNLFKGIYLSNSQLLETVSPARSEGFFVPGWNKKDNVSLQGEIWADLLAVLL